MYRFSDLDGSKLESHMLGKLDFPIYLALACYLIGRLCNGNIGYIDKIEL